MQLKRGDTLIEVTLAVAIFALVAAVSIGLMNMGLNTAQAGLEATMARSEMDAQAEALRFIHHSFMAERELADSEKQYTQLWKTLTRDVAGATPGHALLPDQRYNGYYPSEFAFDSCDEVYDSGFLQASRSFVINTRKIQPGAGADINNTIISADSFSRFRPTQLYPRVVYGNGSATNSDDNLYEGSAPYTRPLRVEGLWVYVVRDYTTERVTDTPQFYDFHIRSCWYGPGHTHPTTLATIIRLYNPEYVEEIKK